MNSFKITEIAAELLAAFGTARVLERRHTFKCGARLR